MFFFANSVLFGLPFSFLILICFSRQKLYDPWPFSFNLLCPSYFKTMTGDSNRATQNNKRIMLLMFDRTDGIDTHKSPGPRGLCNADSQRRPTLLPPTPVTCCVIQMSLGAKRGTTYIHTEREKKNKEREDDRLQSESVCRLSSTPDPKGGDTMNSI